MAANFPPEMKIVRLFLLSALAAGFTACEKHPYSDLEKLEHKNSAESQGDTQEKQPNDKSSEHRLNSSNSENH